MNKQAINVDWPRALKFLGGGALAGAGIGATVSFLRHLNSLNERAKKERLRKKEKLDENTLYLNLPSQYTKVSSEKQAGPVTLGLGGLGLLGGGAVSYNAVRELFNAYRKEQVKKELERAQQVFMEDLQRQKEVKKQEKPASEKSADDGFSLTDILLGGGGAGLALAALGSGVLTNKLLNKHFPPPKDPKRLRPERVVVRTTDDADPKQLARGPESRAKKREEVKSQLPDPDTLEGMMRTHLSNPSKVAYEDGTADLVSAVAQGRGEELVDVLHKTASVDALFSASQGASKTPTSPERNLLAVSWISRRPGIKEALAPYILCANYVDQEGNCKIAAEIDPEYHEDLEILFKEASRAVRIAQLNRLCAHIPEMEKVAMPLSIEDMVLTQAIGDLLSKPESETDQGDQTKTPINSDEDAPSSQQSDQDSSEGRVGDELGVDFDIQDADALRFMRRYGDEIRGVLSSSD